MFRGYTFSLSSILSKLGVRGRTRAVLEDLERGYR
jgi:hypothetical protein